MDFIILYQQEVYGDLNIDHNMINTNLYIFSMYFMYICVDIMTINLLKQYTHYSNVLNEFVHIQI